MYRLISFDSIGLAEASRLALAMSGLEWEDVRVDWEGYNDLRDEERLPWGLLPILETPEGTLAESMAILRHAGHLAGLEPSDPWQQAKVGELLSMLDDVAAILRSTYGIEDEEVRVAVRQALVEDDGHLTRALWRLEEHLGSMHPAWAAGTDHPTVADLRLFTTVFGLISGHWDGLELEVLDGFTRLIEFHERITGLPEVAAHYADLEAGDDRWVFRPGALRALQTA